MLSRAIHHVLLALLIVIGCSCAQKRFSFIHVTDTHVGASNAASAAAMYREINERYPKAAFVLHTGDVVESGSAQQYEMNRKALGNLSIPLHAAPGNHDVRWNPLGKEGFEKSVGPLYQSWDYQGVHFVLLDSTVLLSHLGHIDQRQLDWLTGDLARTGRKTPIVIGMHHPIGRGMDEVDNAQALVEIVTGYNVCLWLFGHGHHDLVWAINGVPAVEAKGLYQGSYDLIEVVDDRIGIERRSRDQSLARLASVSISAPTPTRIVPKPAQAVGMFAWQTDVHGEVQSRLLRDGDSLYVTTMAGQLVALRADDGQIKWAVDTGGPVFSSPCVGGGVIYFGSTDHFVYAVDGRSGRVKWKRPTGGGIFAGPAVGQGVVCIPSVDMTIYGLEVKTGEILWKTACQGMCQSRVASDGQRFYLGGWDNYLRCLDARTGRQIWTKKLGKSMYFAPAIASPVIGGDKVFVTTNDGVLHALSRWDGEILWEFDNFSVGYSSPLYREGRIYTALGPKGEVFCLDADIGQPIWQSSAGSVIYDSSFAYGGGRVFIGSANGTVSAFSADDGNLRWQHKLPPGHLLASPAADDRCVYVGSMNGKVAVLRISR